jgi:hypothetical protein
MRRLWQRHVHQKYKYKYKYNFERLPIWLTGQQVKQVDIMDWYQNFNKYKYKYKSSGH